MHQKHLHYTKSNFLVNCDNSKKPVFTRDGKKSNVLHDVLPFPYRYNLVDLHAVFRLK